MSEPLTIAAVCPTFNRPRHLGAAIDCFTKQTYPHRRLIVLDDAGQYESQSGDRWELRSVPNRYPSLGTKRNALAEMALSDPTVDAIAVMDDDDFYFPHWLEAIAEALSRGAWCVAGKIYTEPEPGKLQARSTRYGTIHQFHATWGFRREAFEKVTGYRERSFGEDSELYVRSKMELSDPVEATEKYPPYFLWNGHCRGVATTHISYLPADRGYGLIGQQPIEKAELKVESMRDPAEFSVGD